ncbi:MAG: helix-turn-helix domain-containing protein [Rubrobacter sp.]|nr:helix-turn-helix domain-containing protein [Rubrobacter sp.]
MAGERETPLLIRDFVEDPELGLEMVVGGELSRPVSWVHVTEVLDPSPYIQGGEFILSAGIWGARGGRVDTFVGALARNGAIALGWGLLVEDERVPEDVIRACRSAGLMLLAVPTRTPFIAIGQWFFERVQARREAGLRATIERNERFVRAISSLPGGMRGILDVLRDSVPRNMWVLDGAGRVLAANLADDPPADDPPAEIVSGIVGEPPVETPVSDATVFGVGAGGHDPAYLVVEGPREEIDAEQRAAVDQALPLLEFVVAHEQELREAERRLAAELVEAVLSKRTQFSAGRLEAYGMDPGGPFVGIVATAGKPDPALSAAKRALAPLAGDAVVAAWRDTVTAVIQPAKGRFASDEAGRSLQAALDSAIGIGGEGEGVEGLRRSLIQARQAADLARRRTPPGGYVVYNRAESHALLLALQDEDVLTSFCEALLGEIEDHDSRRNTDLLPTLEAFLASGGRWQETADRLHIHVNTLRHRLARCEELTGRHLSSMDDRVDLYIALRARGVSRTGGVPP